MTWYQYTLLSLILCSPLIWELWNDRNGDSKKDHSRDVFIRILIAYCAGAVCVLIWHWDKGYMGFQWATLQTMKLAILSLSIHFLLFDYLINWILKKPHPFSYLGKTAWMDQQKFWIKIGPWGRLIIRLIPLTLWIFFDV